jgi:hypothetical protein
MAAHRQQWTMPFWLSLPATGEQLCCHWHWQRGSRNKLFSPLVYWFYKNLLMAALPNPFRRCSWGWGMLGQQNHATAPSWWGCFVCLCFASQKSSEREFFRSRRNRLRFKAVNGAGAGGEIDDMERRRGEGRRIIIFRWYWGASL